VPGGAKSDPQFLIVSGFLVSSMAFNMFVLVSVTEALRRSDLPRMAQCSKEVRRRLDLSLVSVEVQTNRDRLTSPQPGGLTMTFPQWNAGRSAHGGDSCSGACKPSTVAVSRWIFLRTTSDPHAFGHFEAVLCVGLPGHT